MEGKRILIIEDDQSLQKALTAACDSEGVTCLHAYDGEEGLTTATKEKPDLIVLDLLMPKKDGMTMLRELRSDDWGRDARVLVLTNLPADSGERVKAAVETYPELYLVKSEWAIGDIIHKMREMLT